MRRLRVIVAALAVVALALFVTGASGRSHPTKLEKKAGGKQ
jgi:hypothetical protein